MKTSPRRLGVERIELEWVDYDRVIGGALCPHCNIKMNVVNVQPWAGQCRIRYHQCVRCHQRYKSMESN